MPGAARRQLKIPATQCSFSCSDGEEGKNTANSFQATCFLSLCYPARLQLLVPGPADLAPGPSQTSGGWRLPTAPPQTRCRRHSGAQAAHQDVRLMCISVPAGIGVSADSRHRAPWGPKDRGHQALCTCAQQSPCRRPAVSMQASSITACLSLCISATSNVLFLGTKNQFLTSVPPHGLVQAGCGQARSPSHRLPLLIASYPWAALRPGEASRSQ